MDINNSSRTSHSHKNEENNDFIIISMTHGDQCNYWFLIEFHSGNRICLPAPTPIGKCFPHLMSVEESLSISHFLITELCVSWDNIPSAREYGNLTGKIITILVFKLQSSGLQAMNRVGHS